ncbi:Chemotaxis response regulator protein-glutamate methylesterase CheB [Methanosarcina barkeri str. Wiesmoor]|nr:chemotaxis response regulator protein-glutamate methylesterase [Methanosarcina barkeri]AKB52989.1 Chemotaxis response regulator protein-glutamate methylesterase CheB [Methanosarcina barkeri str. Wiesmoor]
MTIRALIVDDSALIRKLLSDILSQDPNLRIIGTAFNGKDGLEKIKKLRPDVVLLDNIMPVFDGLKTLAWIVKECPTPVVMISAFGERAEEITLTAFEYGAVDVIQRPEGILSQNMPDMAEEICRKTRAATKANLENLECMRNRELEETDINKREKIEKHRSRKETTSFVRNVLAIGASTGGPRALEKLIGSFPADIPAAVLIVQHMPAGFTASFSKRLDSKTALRVKEAEEGDIIEEGTVLIAPGNHHMEIVQKTVKGRKEEVAHLSCSPKELGSRPSVNALFRSIAPIYGSKIVSLVLTGMNCDGADGAEQVKKMGGKIIAEAQSSCVVYGMPKEVVRRKLADFVLPLDKMAEEIVKIIS